MTGRQFFGLWGETLAGESFSLTKGAEGRLLDAVSDFMTRGRIQAPEESKQPFFALVVKLSHARGMDQEEGFFRAWDQETAALTDEEKDASFLEVLDDFRSVDVGAYEPPASLADRLRPYQVAGFKWLSALFDMGFGGILAETVINEGGYRNEKCKKVVKDYISGDYSYHDKEEEENNQRDHRAQETFVKLDPFGAFSVVEYDDDIHRQNERAQT